MRRNAIFPLVLAIATMVAACTMPAKRRGDPPTPIEQLLISEAIDRARPAASHREAELVHEPGEVLAEMDLGVLLAHGLCRQPGHEETGVAPVGKTNLWMGDHRELETTVLSHEGGGARFAVRQGRLNERPSHEADRVGGPSILSVDIRQEGRSGGGTPRS